MEFSRRPKKPVVQQSSNLYVARGTVLSNLPGVSAPPSFPRNHDEKNEPDKTEASRKNQIDSLPRHTAGSGQLVRTIASNREKAIQISDSELSSSESFKIDRYFEPVAKENSNGLRSTSIDMKKNASNKASDQEVSSRNIRSYLDTLADDPSSTQNQTQSEQESKMQARRQDSHRKTTEFNDRTSSSDDDSVKDDLKYTKINQKKEKLYKDLLSLNQIENNQKRKILEQDRELKIQNMKLNDALMIEKSIKNCRPPSTLHTDENEPSDYSRVPSYTIKNKDFYSREAPSPSRPMIRFPTIVTKYGPQTYSKHSKYNSKPKETLDLYLETTEDLVDATGHIVSTKQSFKYIGKTSGTSKSDLQSKVIYEHHSPVDTDPYVSSYTLLNPVYGNVGREAIQKLTSNPMGPYEVITLDPSESRINHKTEYLNNYSDYGTHRVSVASPKTQLDDSEIKEILRVVDAKDKQKTYSKYGIHRLGDSRTSPVEKQVRSYSARIEPSAQPKTSFYTRMENFADLNEIDQNFVLAGKKSSYTIPHRTGRSLDSDKSIQMRLTKNLKSNAPNRAQTLRAADIDLYSSQLKPNISTTSVVRSISELKDKRVNGFKPIPNYFKSQNPEKKTSSNVHQLSSNRAQTVVETKQKGNAKMEIDLKKINLKPTANLNDNSKYFMKRLADAKDGDLIVKEADESVWNPSFLSTIPHNFEPVASTSTKLFGNIYEKIVV
jgi:hypothetical protein